MALCYVLISMSIFTSKAFWEILCGEAFYFAETIQLIYGASQVRGFLYGMGFHCQDYLSRISFLLF